MIDAASVAKEDLMPYAIHFPGRTGWNYALAHNPGHQWYYKKGLEVRSPCPLRLGSCSLPA